jgi:hypothetical protein
MTLNPDATSMLSLFCEMFCVLAQLANRTVQPAAIPLRKRRVVGFIEIMICRVNEFAGVLQSRGEERQNETIQLKRSSFFPVVLAS